MTHKWRSILLGIAIYGLVTASAAFYVNHLLDPGHVRWERVTVQSGDTLWGLVSSRNPDANVPDLIQFMENRNGLSDTIQPGQDVQIPVQVNQR